MSYPKYDDNSSTLDSRDFTSLDKIAKRIFLDVNEKGFRDYKPDGEEATRDHLIAKMMLAVGECSEAVEELRKNNDPSHIYFREGDGKPEGFGFEIADAIIRLLDTALMANLPISSLIRNKMEFNRTRPYRHGKTV